MNDRASTPARAASPDTRRAPSASPENGSPEKGWPDKGSSNSASSDGSSSDGASSARRVAVLLAIAAIAAVAVADFLTGPIYILAFLFVPVLFVCWWVRDRR